jgi:hypothetical protein
MYYAIHVDDLTEKDRIELSRYNVGAYLYWVIYKLDCPPNNKHFLLTEYEAMGWKFYGVARGYIKIEESMPAYSQLPKDKLTLDPRKNKAGNLIESAPVRYRYTFTEDDIKQGIAFWNKMEPHVQRALKSQARREKLGRLRRLFKRV